MTDPKHHAEKVSVTVGPVTSPPPDQGDFAMPAIFTYSIGQARAPAERGSTVTDPMEKLIADALDKAGISYITEMDGNPSKLDFALANGVQIEVKRFHSPRIAAQMARNENVIAVQGEAAIRFMADLLAGTATGQQIVEAP